MIARLFERNEFPIGLDAPTLHFRHLHVGEADRVGVLMSHRDQDVRGILLVLFRPGFDAFQDLFEYLACNWLIVSDRPLCARLSMTWKAARLTDAVERVGKRTFRDTIHGCCQC